MVESQFVLDLQREAQREALKWFLEARFGALPADVVKQIDSLMDANRVKELLRAAVHVKRLDELPL